MAASANPPSRGWRAATAISATWGRAWRWRRLGPQAAVPVALIFCFDTLLLFSLVPFLMALASPSTDSIGATALDVRQTHRDPSAGDRDRARRAVGGRAFPAAGRAGAAAAISAERRGALRAVYARRHGGAAAVEEDAVGGAVPGRRSSSCCTRSWCFLLLSLFGSSDPDCGSTPRC